MQSEEGSSEGFGVHHPEFQADDTKFAVLNALAYIWDPLPTITNIQYVLLPDGVSNAIPSPFSSC